MRLSRKVLSAVALGTSLFVLTALGAAPPADKASPADEGALLKAATGSCCAVEVEAKAVDSCCAGEEAAVTTAGDPLLALLIQDGDKAKAEPSDELTPEQAEKGVAARKALLAQLMALIDSGRADCCNDPGCGFCLIGFDKCVCGPNLTKGEPVCPECWGGWQAGHGMIPNVKPEDVKVLPTKELKELYDLRAKNLEAAANAK